MSKPPVATKAILHAADPPARSECAILPPSFTSDASVWKVLDLEGSVGELRLEPYSMPILPVRIQFRLSVRREHGLVKGWTYKA